MATDLPEVEPDLYAAYFDQRKWLLDLTPEKIVKAKGVPLAEARQVLGQMRANWAVSEPPEEVEYSEADAEVILQASPEYDLP